VRYSRNFTLKSGGDQWRRQDVVPGGHDDRGAEWGGVWGGMSAPQPTTGSGGASWAPPAGCGAEPRPLFHFLHILGHKTLLVARKIRVSCPKVVVTVTTTSKNGSDKSLSSHTKLSLWYYRHDPVSCVSVPVSQVSVLSKCPDEWSDATESLLLMSS